MEGGNFHLKTKTRSNEITAIPEIPDLLEIKGRIITIDAMGTQKAIAEKITDKESHFILVVKDNRKTLHEEVQEACKRSPPSVL
jgi:predicted transposase YbfD/YdcC